MKKLQKIILLSMALISLSVSAQAKEVFLCMQNEQNVAISIDESGVLEYINMTDSNGVKVIPQISGDGNTYLPFRFVCEMAGFADAEKTPDSDNYFKFIGADPNEDGSRQKIEICKDGNVVTHEVGVEFSYEVSEGDIRNVCIYNIEGSLYFPMTYMTRITDARTFWCAETGDIIFATSGIDISEYIDGNAKLLDSAMNKSAYYPVLDEDRKDGYYMSSSGEYARLDGANGDIYRVKNTLYYLDGSQKLVTKEEGAESASKLNFKDMQGNEPTVYTEDFMIFKNKIYGIDTLNSKLFICNADGSDFSYITDKGVYGLFFKKYNRKDYLYYCDRESKAEIHMIELSTGDDYTIEITDLYHNNLLSDIASFTVEDKVFTYVDGSGQIHTINLPDPLEEFEIARVADHQHTVMTTWE